MADGRFAPSPTGPLHLGNLRTALVAWLFARSSSGAFRLRIEDLDQVASRPEIAAQQLADLTALGLEWDGDVLRQSERTAIYHDALAVLVRAGRTYPCYCSRREIREAVAAPQGDPGELAYPGTCRVLSTAERAAREADGRRPALRLRADGERITVVDRLCGEYTAVVDDVVLQRNDGTPAYNLAVVVDDDAQGIDEVVRGDDLFRTTHRQVFLAELLGCRTPAYAHVPLVLGPDGERLAKRHGAVTLGDRLARGDTARSVLGELASSLGLAGRDDVPSGPADLLARFTPEWLPRTPWRLEPSQA